MHLNPWNILLIAIAGWMNQELAAAVEYLKEENRVLRELLGKRRPRLNNEQRRRLVRAGFPHVKGICCRSRCSGGCSAANSLPA